MELLSSIGSGIAGVGLFLPPPFNIIAGIGGSLLGVIGGQSTAQAPRAALREQIPSASGQSLITSSMESRRYNDDYPATPTRFGEDDPQFEVPYE